MSVETAELSEKIKLHPNPASTQLTLDFGKAINLEEITIMDILGSTIDTLHFAGKTLQSIDVDIDDLPKGQYFIRVNFGTKTMASIFIKS